ncbi:hypothetical protein BT93_A0403 [Corymbia citriodora subsp. variegata]|nr:hypothetical protein BT93_A0403 [Corymbia citriodora subsp. variegata]
MDLLHLICPSSPSVWDGNRLADCFSNIALAFGGNVVTIFMIAMLGITNRNKQRNWRMKLVEKAVFYVLPILGASLSFLDVAFLLHTAYNGGLVMYHAWLFRCSRFAVWALILALKCPCGSSIFYSRVLCFWWAIKPLFMIPNLQATFHLLEVPLCINESCMFLLDVMLGVSLNVIRVKRAPSKSRSRSVSTQCIWSTIIA